MTRHLSYRAAWREVAKLWMGPGGYDTDAGLCATIQHLRFDYRRITKKTENRMRARVWDVLGRRTWFAPLGRQRKARAMLALLFAEGA